MTLKLTKLDISRKRIDVCILFSLNLYSPKGYTGINKEKDIRLIAESMFNDIVTSIKNYNIIMDESEL